MIYGEMPLEGSDEVEHYKYFRNNSPEKRDKLQIICSGWDGVIGLETKERKKMKFDIKRGFYVTVKRIRQWNDAWGECWGTIKRVA